MQRHLVAALREMCTLANRLADSDSERDQQIRGRVRDVETVCEVCSMATLEQSVVVAALAWRQTLGESVDIEHDVNEEKLSGAVDEFENSLDICPYRT